MTQNDNDNLFNFDKPQSEQPQQPEEPQQPYSVSGEPTPTNEPEGAQVYSTPPSYQAPEPPPYTPPYTPPLPPVQPPKRDNRVWIIAIVVILLLCCCCLVLAAVWLWNNGDRYIQDFSYLAPALYQILA